MVELQSCASLVNASALCAIEQEVKGEGTIINAIAEISTELQREREKNAELMKRISALEAQIQGRDKESFIANGQVSCINATERSLRRFKKQKTDKFQNRMEEKKFVNGELVSQMKLDRPHKDTNVEDILVNWMSMDETQFLHIDKSKDDELAADCDDTEDSDEEEDCEEVDARIDHKNGETYVNAVDKCAHQQQNGSDDGTDMASLGNFFDVENATVFTCPNQEPSDDRKDFLILSDAEQAQIKRGLHKQDKKETENIGNQKTSADGPLSNKEAYQTGPGNISFTRKPPKMAFCPKEVKRILESEALLVKNAQSHTIRKIIVFASFGIRHGCDDMYELDFNHFSILRKGQPYMSAKDPGEHVLYENPGIRRKIFFPNRQNPTLCPVQILEEEKAMRPSDPNCPSCLFLCIKYGGRTRNLPQNEYVRQRMGRNKLKSFGPVMCRMAMLVHIRNGSFFFKALGITLLFMAGFPDDLVQRETKYRNLDLLHKYYRRDEDAEGEKLFLPHLMTCDTANPGSDKLTGKTITTKSKGKKQENSTSNRTSVPRSSGHQSVLSRTAPSAQFGLMGYTPIQTQALASFHSMRPQTPQDILQVPSRITNSFNTKVSCNNPTPYHTLPPQPAANAFVPMLYWSAPNAFPPGPYASLYGYPALSSSTNYISIHPHPYYSSSLTPKLAEMNWKNDAPLEESVSDSDSSSSSTEPKEA